MGFLDALRGGVRDFSAGLSHASNQLPGAIAQAAQTQAQTDRYEDQKAQTDLDRRLQANREALGVWTSMFSTMADAGLDPAVAAQKIQQLQQEQKALLSQDPPVTGPTASEGTETTRRLLGAGEAPPVPEAATGGDIGSIGQRLLQVRQQEIDEKDEAALETQFRQVMGKAESRVRATGKVEDGLVLISSLMPNLPPAYLDRATQGLEGAVPNTNPEEIDQLARLAAANPVYMEHLTRYDRSAVIKSMVRQGLGPSNPMDRMVMQQLHDFDTSLWELSKLSGIIEENPELFGPVVGRLYPWLLNSQVRTDQAKIIADLDRVRQLVGKAMEDGVLRKEDEEKYKRILATVTDEPNVALFKVKSVLRSLKFQRDHFVKLARSSGEFVDPEVLGATMPVDPNTATKEDLLFFVEEWPELYQTIERRFPELLEVNIDG